MAGWHWSVRVMVSVVAFVVHAVPAPLGETSFRRDFEGFETLFRFKFCAYGVDTIRGGSLVMNE